MNTTRTAWRTIQIIGSGLVGLVGGFLGGIDGMMQTLIAFIVIDYITGFMAAIVEHKLSSEVGYHGIFKKVCILLLVGVSNYLDVNMVSYLVEGGAICRTFTSCFFIANEGVSILENAGRIGLPIPDKLRDVLIQISDKGGKEHKTDGE